MLQAEEILVERYQLQRVLGKSAIRQTWLARDLTNQEQVVVKLLTANDQLQWYDIQLFEREAKVLRQLNHLRIPQYYDDFVLERDVIYFALVQEYIAAKSIKELLASGKIFSETEVREIAIAVLKILIYLHKLNPPVLHRDIKPSNLLLDESTNKNQIYLVDFGAVQDRVAAEGATFTVVGTYGYAPLEQFGGRATPASDLYALGATLIHLATGISPADLPQFDSRMQFSHLIEFNPGLIKWLQQMTEPNLEYRFGRATEALKALETNELAINNHNIDNQILDPSVLSINKSLKKLEIYISSDESPIKLIFGGGALFLWMHFILNSGGMASTWVGLLFFILGALIAAWLTLPGFVENQIIFNHKKFEIRWKLFGMTLRKQRGNVLEIEKAYISRTGGMGYKKVLEIILAVGVDEYSFGRLKTGLTKKESQHIASEIRNWLGI
ncbi:serine/threonine protein kinase [Plectonema cf. radiosum LEGE 06105]|uniref:Serine/threonine protein kinase n=1 Tax=Plectonema cf. radiosum LEGE 06105 TaxID=945769 RepID=A0A8J7F9Q8_9CYAN|nr:serine/threonine-protein kinase [Plectonema radiosum]MBE9217010.1 serine/threonine protein kinase [Plectonema cf. radiosum LEGE 06105]